MLTAIPSILPQHAKKYGYNRFTTSLETYSDADLQRDWRYSQMYSKNNLQEKQENS